MFNPPGQGSRPLGQGINSPKRGPGGVLSPPPRRQGVRGRGQGSADGKGAGVAGAALPGPGGRQLQARVSSGAISQEQAQRTMQQRQTLQKALGENWREKLQVGGKSFADVNKGLKTNPDDPKLAAIRKKLLTNRKSVLEAARKKNKGGSEEGEE